MTDHITPAQRERIRQQARARAERAAADRQRQQAQLAAALQHGANQAKADALLRQLVTPDVHLYSAQVVLVATAALVLLGALRVARDWSGHKRAAELRAQLRRLT